MGDKGKKAKDKGSRQKKAKQEKKLKGQRIKEIISRIKGGELCLKVVMPKKM